MTEQTRSAAVIERTFRASLDELWQQWTTKEGFESWWGPEGFQVQVHQLEARPGGLLHYDMIAVGAAEIAAMQQMGWGTSHAVRARFSEIRQPERLVITSVVDFVPGVAPYESTIAVDFFPSGDTVRMVVTLERMHDEELTRRAILGFTSQLRKLEKRFHTQADTVLAQRIAPCLWYAKDAVAAARFYASVFPDSHVDVVTTLPVDTPSGPAGTVELVHFTVLGQKFVAMSAGEHHPFNDAISLVVLCGSQAELDRYWNLLLDSGGRPQACGWIIDRYGVRWQIVPRVLFEMIGAADRATAARAAAARLTQVLLDLAALQAAFEGKAGG
jgi:predicted 3-demethylubiquinone-9 3-methyltransferase (glyoxalase superfamily)/uncharacterized protein YndB with AHSA1/START domain